MADDFQHIGRRRLLLQRFLQIVRTLFSLRLQRRLRPLEAAGHRVEAIGQDPDLVTGAYGDALGKIAFGEPLDALLQPPDRGDHAAREPDAGHGREQKPDRQEQRGFPEQGIDRRQRLGGRRLHEHGPAEARYRRVGGERRLPVKAFRLGCGSRSCGGERCGDLRQAGHVSCAEHEAAVRMRDQLAVPANDEGVAGLADLDGGNLFGDRY